MTQPTDIAAPARLSPDGEVRVFGSPILSLDHDALARLAAHVPHEDLAAPPIVLPDFHQEAKMEVPCSIAVATRESIRPALANASLNCGMALIALETGRPDRQAIECFFRQIRGRLPYPSRRRRELSTADVLRASTDGSMFAVERSGVDAAELDRVEENGRIDLEPFGGRDRLERELPWLAVQLARLRFGTVGPSNHFIEVQEVESIFDPEIAATLGIARGQITIQYHAGGGVLTGLIGRMFGRRVDYPAKHRAIMSISKPRMHLATAHSLSELRARFALYFSNGCPPVPLDSDEGRRMLLANAAAMNYGFAFRLTVYAALRELARTSLGATSSRLVVDSPHDTIYQEEVGGEPAVVHRYKSCRAFPADRMEGHPAFGHTGQPVLIPGTNRTSSYLCVAGAGAQASLYSACHGTGTIIADLARRGISGPDPQGRTTLRFGYDSDEPRTIAHLDDAGIDEALGVLTRSDIVRPVARLRPIAVIT